MAIARNLVWLGFAALVGVAGGSFSDNRKDEPAATATAAATVPTRETRDKPRGGASDAGLTSVQLRVNPLGTP